MAESLITQHIDLWTSAIEAKSTAGRGSKNKFDLYGIKKLRELILALAMRGKLVPQNSTDELASVLLNKIVKEYKNFKKFSEVSNDLKPYPLPISWEWILLPEIYDSISPSGNKVKSSEILTDGLIPVVDQGAEYITGYTNSIELKINISDPVVIFGDHTTNLKYVDFDFVAGADGTKILKPIGINPKFFFMQLNSYTLENRGYSRHFKILNQQYFALPPLLEQARIVAKVDELMALCDQLEQQTLTSIDAHATLVETLLETLTNSADAAELEQNWARISEHFDTLFTTEQSIDALKQTILQLAVMGKLVRQDPTDEPASVLLGKIAAEKAQLIKDKKIKKEKPLPPISDYEKPFELPQGWEWCRFEDVVDIQSGITKGRSLSGRELTTVKYLAVANVQRGYLQLDGLKEIELPVDELEKYRVINNDLLITEGGDWDKVGRTAIWRDEIPYVAHQNHVFKARVFIEAQSETWLEIYLNSPFAREYFAGSSKQTTNLASINKTQLRGCDLTQQQRTLS